MRTPAEIAASGAAWVTENELVALCQIAGFAMGESKTLPVPGCPTCGHPVVKCPIHEPIPPADLERARAYVRAQGWVQVDPGPESVERLDEGKGT